MVVQDVIHEQQWHPSRLADMQLSLLVRNPSIITMVVVGIGNRVGCLQRRYHQQWLSHAILYFQYNNQYSNSVSDEREHWLTKHNGAVAAKVKGELKVRMLCSFDVSHF
jgi:hypothetical protein